MKFKYNLIIAYLLTILITTTSCSQQYIRTKSVTPCKFLISWLMLINNAFSLSQNSNQHNISNIEYKNEELYKMENQYNLIPQNKDEQFSVSNIKLFEDKLITTSYINKYKYFKYFTVYNRNNLSEVFCDREYFFNYDLVKFDNKYIDVITILDNKNVEICHKVVNFKNKACVIIQIDENNCSLVDNIKFENKKYVDISDDNSINIKYEFFINTLQPSLIEIQGDINTNMFFFKGETENINFIFSLDSLGNFKYKFGKYKFSEELRRLKCCKNIDFKLNNCDLFNSIKCANGKTCCMNSWEKNYLLPFPEYEDDPEPVSLFYEYKNSNSVAKISKIYITKYYDGDILFNLCYSDLAHKKYFIKMIKELDIKKFGFYNFCLMIDFKSNIYNLFGDAYSSKIIEFLDYLDTKLFLDDDTGRYLLGFPTKYNIKNDLELV